MIVLTIILLLLSAFFIWRHKAIKRIEKVRDALDFTIPEEKLLIDLYNKRIDQINGIKRKRHT